MKNDMQDPLNSLKNMAERLGQGKVAPNKDISNPEIEKMIQDVREHQIELEMQNEALKKIQQELESSRDRYRELFDLAPVAFLCLDAEGKIIEANQATTELLNEERKTLVRKRLSEYLTRDSQDDFHLHCGQALDLGSRTTCEVRINRKGGAPFHARLETVAVRFDPRSGQTKNYLRTAISDISVHKQLESELEGRVEKHTAELMKANRELQQQVSYRQEVQERLESEHAFRKTIEETIPSGLIVVDTEGQIIYVNQAFCDMVEWSAVELIGSRPPYKYWPPAESEERTRVFLKTLSEVENPYDVERQFRRRNGELFWGLVFSTRFSNSKGRIIGRLSSVIDITARKKDQEAVKHSEERLRDLSMKLIQVQETERKRISQELHDSIGAGLSAIKFSLEKKISEMGSPPGHGPVLEDIVVRLQNIIIETQRISRNLHPSILDDLGIHAAIRSFCREYQEIYSEIRMEQHVDIDEDELPENIKLLIYRLIQESLNNIAKHSGAKQVNLSLTMTGHAVELSVEDNGTGFDLNTLNKNRDTRIGGLGLRGMKERTELSGGSFEVRSTVGAGTKVRAKWPIQE